MPGSADSLIVRLAPLIFVFFWSTGFIAAKYGLPYAEPLTFLSTRMALVVVILAGIVAVTRPRWPSKAEALHSGELKAKFNDDQQEQSLSLDRTGR